jgi:glycosyltransferase involved in cell wall biosynthesis
MLEDAGHSVTRYVVHAGDGPQNSRASLAMKAIWNRATYRELASMTRAQKFDVAHFQNTFPLLSPSAYYAMKAAGVPIVQSIRNYRMTCVNGLLFRNGKVCTECVGAHVPWRGVLHRCYRGSIAASATVAGMLAFHKARRTYSDVVDAYIALTESSKSILAESGIPSERVFVKPNAVVPDPGVGPGNGGFALYAGRLSEEKGVDTLLEAWASISPRIPLLLVGDGALSTIRGSRGQPDVHFLGQQSVADTYRLMGSAALVVVPSRWMEPFGRVVIEAYAKGTPVLAAATGALAELVDHGRTGRLFAPGDVLHLAKEASWFFDNPLETSKMRVEARKEYLAKYSSGENVRQLLSIYSKAICRRKRFMGSGRAH